MDEAWPMIGLGMHALAAAAIAWWLLADWVHQRVRPRRRCPKCWYDMRATEGLRCPDCGRAATSERALWTARRRRGWLALAGALLVAGYGVRVRPAVEERGWPAAVPTTVAIWMLSPTDGLPWPNPNEDSGWWRGAIAKPLFEDLIFDRAAQGSLTPAQYEWLAQRCIRGDAERRPLSWRWRPTYGELLHTIEWRDSADAAWQDDAKELVELRFGPAAGRPALAARPFELDIGESVVLSIHIDDWGGIDPRWDRRYRIIGRPAKPGFEPFDIVRGYDLVANAAVDQPARFDVKLGRSDGPLDRIVYEIEIHDERAIGGEANADTLCRHYLVRLPIRIMDRGKDGGGSGDGDASAEERPAD